MVKKFDRMAVFTVALGSHFATDDWTLVCNVEFVFSFVVMNRYKNSLRNKLDQNATFSKRLYDVVFADIKQM